MWKDDKSQKNIVSMERKNIKNKRTAGIHGKPGKVSEQFSVIMMIS